MSSADRYWTGPFPARSAKQVAADAAYKQAMLFANTPVQRAKDDMFAMIKEDLIHCEPGASNATLAPSVSGRNAHLSASCIQMPLTGPCQPP